MNLSIVVSPASDDVLDFPKLPARIHAKIRQLAKQPKAVRKYDLMSSAFAWTDEFTMELVLELIDYQCYLFRYLWAYRASLIVGNPDHRFHKVWNGMKAHFPDWPGFSAERVDQGLRVDLLAEQQAGAKAWEEFLDGFPEDQEETRVWD